MNSKQIKALLVSMILGINLTACKSSKDLKKEDNIELNKVSYDTFLNDLNNINKILETNKEYQRIKAVSLNKNSKNLNWEESNYISISYEEKDNFVKGIFDYFGNTLFFNERIVYDDMIIDYTKTKISTESIIQYHYFSKDIGNLTLGLYPPSPELKISYNDGMVEIHLSANELNSFRNNMQNYGNNVDYLGFLVDNKELINYYLKELHIPKKYHLNGKFINGDTFTTYVDTFNTTLKLQRN